MWQAKLDCAHRHPHQPRSAPFFPLDRRADEGGIAASGDSVWIVTDDAGTLVRIDPATNKVRQRISIAPGSYNPCFSDGTVWITGRTANLLTAVDAIDRRRSGHNPRRPEAQISDREPRIDLDFEPGRRNSDPGRCAEQESDCHNHGWHSGARRRHRMGGRFRLDQRVRVPLTAIDGKDKQGDSPVGRSWRRFFAFRSQFDLADRLQARNAVAHLPTARR